MIDEQTPPLLADEQSVNPAPRRVPPLAILAAIVVAVMALGSMGYLANRMLHRHDQPPAPSLDASRVSPSPVAPPANQEKEREAGESPAQLSEHVAALRVQVHEIGARVDKLETQIQEALAVEPRVVSLEQSVEQTKHDQEALAQRIGQQAQRKARAVPKTKTSPSPAEAARPTRNPVAALQQPPFPVMGVEHWGGMAQVAILRTPSTTTWLAPGESWAGWQVLAIQGTEVVWRTPTGQTVTQPLEGQ